MLGDSGKVARWRCVRPLGRGIELGAELDEGRRGIGTLLGESSGDERGGMLLFLGSRPGRFGKRAGGPVRRVERGGRGDCLWR